VVVCDDTVLFLVSSFQTFFVQEKDTKINRPWSVFNSTNTYHITVEKNICVRSLLYIYRHASLEEKFSCHFQEFFFPPTICCWSSSTPSFLISGPLRISWSFFCSFQDYLRVLKWCLLWAEYWSAAGHILMEFSKYLGGGGHLTTLSVSYTASNEMMSDGWWIEKYLEGSGSVLVEILSRLPCGWNKEYQEDPQSRFPVSW
jgi:hypothetical protein